MTKNHEVLLYRNICYTEIFTIFAKYKNLNYGTYEAPTPCIASAHRRHGLQANWPSNTAWFAYSIPPNMQKMPKKIDFSPRAETGKGVLGKAGGGK